MLNIHSNIYSNLNTRVEINQNIASNSGQQLARNLVIDLLKIWLYSGLFSIRVFFLRFCDRFDSMMKDYTGLQNKKSELYF